MSNQSLFKPIIKSEKTHHCTICIHRAQRFIHEYNIDEINGGCLDCVKESNFKKMSEKQMHGVK